MFALKGIIPLIPTTFKMFRGKFYGKKAELGYPRDKKQEPRQDLCGLMLWRLWIFALQ